MSTYPRLDSTGLNTLLSQLVTDGDGRWVKKVDLVKASASADGLMSKEDFSKLGGIESGAQVNVIESVSVNGNALTPTEKGVDVTVPTRVSDLSNDSNFQTATEVSTSIANAIAGVTQFDYEVVAALPASGVKGKIYLVANTGTGTNIYDEYIWIAGEPTGHFELLGTTEMDLSGYVQATEMTTIPDADIIAAVNSAFGVSGS